MFGSRNRTEDLLVMSLRWLRKQDNFLDNFNLVALWALSNRVVNFHSKRWFTHISQLLQEIIVAKSGGNQAQPCHAKYAKETSI